MATLLPFKYNTPLAVPPDKIGLAVNETTPVLLAIDAADQGDYSLIDELYNVLKKPYNEQPEYEKWFAKRPDCARSKVGCSMLSCSS